MARPTRGSRNGKPSNPPASGITSAFQTTKVHERPISKAIPQTHKKRALTTEMDQKPVFRILDLPVELRLKIYAFILPSNERIFLDPDNFYHPLPYTRTSYGSTFTLLQLCKKVHYEAAEFIFSNNTVNIIRPKLAGNFLVNLGDTALQHITKLECHMYRDLGDLGRIWRTMSKCPKLDTLRLVFYHDRIHWHHIATQMAYRSIQSKGQLTFELELYDSIWAASLYGFERDTFLSMADAEAHAKVYSVTIPSPLKKIVVTASISREVTAHLLRSNGGKDWKLRQTGRQQNGEINTLIWTGTKVGRDVELATDFYDQDDDDDYNDDDDEVSNDF